MLCGLKSTLYDFSQFTGFRTGSPIDIEDKEDMNDYESN